jgi:hypothetical protein
MSRGAGLLFTWFCRQLHLGAGEAVHIIVGYGDGSDEIFLAWCSTVHRGGPGESRSWSFLFLTLWALPL